MGWTAARRGACTAAALLLALPASACGAGGDDAGPRRLTASTTSAATPTSEGSAPAEIDRSDNPASAYTAWVGALARHDAAAACDLQSPDFTIQLRYDAILVDRAELGDPCVGFEAIVWEAADFDATVEDVAVTQQTGEDALLEVHLATRSLTVRMVYHRAHWRVFSTTDRTDGGSTDGATTGPARWVAAWCGLSLEQTRDEIVDAMGEPSGEYTVSDGGDPQLWWAQDQYDFRVYLDTDGTVFQLVADYDALGTADRAELTCPELRS
ncbi:hypothetical protein [Nocardioides sp. MH1]|uniref:hypothetical protein n=1 Tax=Nocardioides sp. MH1 TaxID=3242490 RepID=UPI003521703E